MAKDISPLPSFLCVVKPPIFIVADSIEVGVGIMDD